MALGAANQALAWQSVGVLEWVAVSYAASPAAPSLLAPSLQRSLAAIPAARPSVNTMCRWGRVTGVSLALQKFLNGCSPLALRVLPPCSHIVFIKQHQKFGICCWMSARNLLLLSYSCYCCCRLSLSCLSLVSGWDFHICLHLTRLFMFIAR